MYDYSSIILLGAVLKPWFEIDGRNYPKPTLSFREMHIKDIVKDVKHWMSFISNIMGFSNSSCPIIIAEKLTFSDDFK